MWVLVLHSIEDVEKDTVTRKIYLFLPNENIRISFHFQFESHIKTNAWKIGAHETCAKRTTSNFFFTNANEKEQKKLSEKMKMPNHILTQNVFLEIFGASQSDVFRYRAPSAITHQVLGKMPNGISDCIKNCCAKRVEACVFIVMRERKRNEIDFWSDTWH